MRIGIAGLLVATITMLGTTLGPNAASAQSNTISGLDLKMHNVDHPTVMGRIGTFPTGTCGISIDTEVCNVGTVGIEWKQAMNPDHPFIKFLIAREDGGRFEQISDRSFIKHTFYATNTSTCAHCTDTSDSTVLAVGCSDTYGTAENGDRYWLGPPGELDPWLGDWDPNCSYFDRGDPPAAPPFDCDGIRSLSRTQSRNLSPELNRMIVTDADLNVAGARYFFYGEYMVRGEAESVRRNNCVSREFAPAWNGTRWDLPVIGSKVIGSILENWTGATLRSSTNGGDDGRVYLASKVTGPDVNGLYHYEYAVHNRDNSRALGALSIPICPGASVLNAGFRDIDADAGNDWAIQAGPSAVTWSSATNPLEWNTIYNFWFDSDAPPADARSLVQESRAGAGLPAFVVVATAPMGPALGTDLGSGKSGGNGLVPDLAMCGGLGIGETTNIMVRYAAPNALAYAFVSDQNLGLDYRGGTIVPFPPVVIIVSITDGAGEIAVSLAGIGGTFDIFIQVVVLDAAAAGEIALTNALEVTH